MVTIHGKMAYTLEQATQMIDHLNEQTDYLNQQINQLMARAASAGEEHKQRHMEVKGQLAQANAGGNSEFRLIDPKTMAPEKLGSS